MTAPERAVTKHGKGRPMKAFLKKKWGANYAGQVLTNVEKGSIPAEVADFYEDDQPTPNDIVKDDAAGNEQPLTVVNDEIDPAKAKAAGQAQADKVKAAQGASAAPAVDEDAETQRRAHEADEFAAKRAGSGKAPKASKEQKKKANAGKDHGVK